MNITVITVYSYYTVPSLAKNIIIPSAYARLYTDLRCLFPVDYNEHMHFNSNDPCNVNRILNVHSAANRRGYTGYKGTENTAPWYLRSALGVVGSQVKLDSKVKYQCLFLTKSNYRFLPKREGHVYSKDVLKSFINFFERNA